MNKITEEQFNMLVDEIYSNLMGASIACKCEETASFSLGDMGEVRDSAQRVARSWCERADIESFF